MGMFTELFQFAAYDLLEEYFAIDVIVKLKNRRTKDTEEILIKGLLFDPNTGKSMSLQDYNLNQVTTMAIRINRELAKEKGIDTFVLRDAQIEILGDLFLVTQVSNSDELFFRISLERVEPKEIVDRGRRDY